MKNRPGNEAKEEYDSINCKSRNQYSCNDKRPEKLCTVISNWLSGTRVIVLIRTPPNKLIMATNADRQLELDSTAVDKGSMQCSMSLTVCMMLESINSIGILSRSPRTKLNHSLLYQLSTEKAFRNIRAVEIR